jgi:nucleoside-diphosphate-sugar epimerase
MQVLITSHTGYIGSVLSRVLARAGHQVSGLDADLYRACAFGPAPAAIPGVEADLRDLRPEALEGFEAIVHLAALSNDPLSALDPRLTHEINHRASMRLAGLARRAGVARFVFASSCSVYGSAGDGLLTERSARAPLTAYALTKALVEDGLHALASPTFSPTILRNATAYGASPRLRLDIVLNDLVAQAVTTGRIELRSTGLAWRPMVHVDDISEAARCVLKAPRDAVHDEVFNVGATSENYRVVDMVARILEQLPLTRVAIAAGAASDARDYHVSCDAIRTRVPAFEPRWTLAKGIGELIDAYRDAGLRTTDFGRYLRLPEIRRRQALGELGADLRGAGPGAASRAA